MTEQAQVPELTPEQIAAAAEATAAAAAAVQAKADKKAADAVAKAEKKALAEAAKLAAKAEKEAAKAAKEAEKEAAKAAKEAAKLVEKPAKIEMPEQNGVRRPKPDTLCGKAWGLADELSRTLGQPAPIASLITAATAAGLNEGNVRAEYARWRKFNGVTGRVTAPAPAVPEAPAVPPVPEVPAA